MSTVKASNIQNAGSATTNLALDTNGNATCGGVVSMASSFVRNKIINGGFDVWQRGTAAVSVFAYFADRWLVYAQSGLTANRSSDVPNSKFQWSMSISGTGYPEIVQRIEAANCLGLVGNSATVSFWMKRSSGASPAAVEILYANATDNFNGGVTSIASTAISAQSSWTYHTVTFNNLPASAANGVELRIYGCQTGAAAFLVTGVQLEEGSIATPFERRPYGHELALCQRYCEVGTGTVTVYAGSVATNQTTNAISFHTTKRGTTSVVLSNIVYIFGSALAVNTASADNVYFTMTTGGSGTSGASFTYTATSEL